MNEAAPGSMLEPDAVVELGYSEADASVALSALQSVVMAVKVILFFLCLLKVGL